jgi:hypothetical protein
MLTLAVSIPTFIGGTLHLSVRYSGFAKFSFDFDISAIRAVGKKKTITEA